MNRMQRLKVRTEVAIRAPRFRRSGYGVRGGFARWQSGSGAVGPAGGRYLHASPNSRDRPSREARPFLRTNGGRGSEPKAKKKTKTKKAVLCKLFLSPLRFRGRSCFARILSPSDLEPGRHSDRR